MSQEPIPPYPKNAPGDFYIQNECCISCEAPSLEAPDLMEHDDEGAYNHCYFKKQPETPEEVERAVMACVVSCVRAVRYAGKNPKILKRFHELGCKDSCDVPIGRANPEVRLFSDREVDKSQPPTSGEDHPLWDRDLDH